jgi:DNA-binding transcriptional ArsR family regulator
MTPRPLAVGEEPPPMNSDPPRSTPAKTVKAKAKQKAGDRFAVLNAFIDFSLAELSRAEIALWLILYRDTREGTARTAYDDLARRAGLNRRNVGRALRRLEKRGLLQVVHRGGLGRGVSRYRVRPLTKDA